MNMIYSLTPTTPHHPQKGRTIIAQRPEMIIVCIIHRLLAIWKNKLSILCIKAVLLKCPLVVFDFARTPHKGVKTHANCVIIIHLLQKSHVPVLCM